MSKKVSDGHTMSKLLLVVKASTNGTLIKVPMIKFNIGESLCTLNNFNNS